jgi:hypothetical protein
MSPVFLADTKLPTKRRQLAFLFNRPNWISIQLPLGEDLVSRSATGYSKLVQKVLELNLVLPATGTFIVYGQLIYIPKRSFV